LLQPDVRARLLTMGSDIKPMSTAQFAGFVKTELAKYKEVVKLSGASVN
jgi:tripartite-type tricarboxylate transporter receptor subunit TctC